MSTRSIAADAEVLASAITWNGYLIQVERVTPERARLMLGHNRRNRNLRERGVAQLEGAMRSEDWVFNGDPIRFDADDVLRDGQHRLEACVRSGETIDVLVIYGLPAWAQETMDLGRKRTVADALQMRGLRHPATLAGGLNLLNSWTRVGMLVARDSWLTPKRAEALLDAHPKMLECTSPSTALKRLATPSIWCAVTYILREVDPVEADAFLVGISSQIGLFPGDPRLALRKRLELAKGASGVSLDPSAQAWLVLRAWLAFQGRRSLRTLPLPHSTMSQVAWERVRLPGDEMRLSASEVAA